MRIARGPKRAPGRDDALVERRADDRDVGVRRRGATRRRWPTAASRTTVPIRVVGQIGARELGELVVTAQLAVLQPEVGRIGHAGESPTPRPP